MYDPVASTVLSIFGTCIIESYRWQSAFPLFFYDLHCEKVGKEFIVFRKKAEFRFLPVFLLLTTCNTATRSSSTGS